MYPAIESNVLEGKIQELEMHFDHAITTVLEDVWNNCGCAL